MTLRPQLRRPAHDGVAVGPGIEEPLISVAAVDRAVGPRVLHGRSFPEWKGNLFVGSVRRGEVPRTGGLERVVVNDKLEELRRETLLTELHQRIRDVRQGPGRFALRAHGRRRRRPVAHRADDLSNELGCVLAAGHLAEIVLHGQVVRAALSIPAARRTE